jgi:hypothetical protein
MINEKQLSEYFHSFWQDHFPLLDPMFVRRFNVEQKERLETTDGRILLPISLPDEIERFDLVAEVASELAIESYRKRSGGTADHGAAIARARKRIAFLRGVEIAEPADNELSQADLLLNHYEAFFDTIEREGAVEFRPRIKGIGVLREMEGDLSTAKTLFEVKAVNRNIQGSDLRQLICYLVAGLASRQYTWDEYCIFNPRLAVYYSGRVSELLDYLSGRSAPECISEFTDALLEREQPLEAKF